MPKVKIHRQPPTVDMTAMTDVAFLLLTFFMLTAKMKQSDPIQVDTPSSVSETVIEKEDMMILSVDKESRVFMQIDNQVARRTMGERLNSVFNLGLNEEELHAFEVYPSAFGIPKEQMKAALKLPPLEREAFMLKSTGIRCDSVPANDELANWVYQARYAYAANDRKLRIVIKADNDAKYPVIQRVLTTMKQQDIHAFNLVTDLEKGKKTAE